MRAVSVPSVLITAGPTRERIDPVRFISNYSTGSFGYEIAKQARERGARTVLISGPVNLEAPRGVKVVPVESAVEMMRSVAREFKDSDIVIMAAAVSDWRVKTNSRSKIKRKKKTKTLALVQNPDILAWLGRKKSGRVLVGFALETENLEANAITKLQNKNLDLIIANRLTAKRRIFGGNPTSIVMIDKMLNKKFFKNKTKRELANIILDKAFRINIG